jgi:cellulase
MTSLIPHIKGRSVRESVAYLRRLLTESKVAYLAPASSNGNGNTWVKIFHEGNPGPWAVEKLISNRGKVGFRDASDGWPLGLNRFLQYGIPIPSNLAPGQYILRVEIIALHEADTLYSQNHARGAQFYPSCIQIKVTGSGKKKLPSGVSFPG